MKKYIISAFALVFGTLAFGQVTVDPPGPAQGTAPVATAVANLSGDADANTGLSIQNGDDNRVRVRQAGTNQSVYTNQDNGAGLGGNQARVRQTGAVSAASGVENLAEVLQSGTTNQSTTRQEGDRNNAVTRQGQNNLTSIDNKALIRQGVANQAEDNYAAIEQDGARHQATIQQTWDNSDAWTRQRGSANKSMILQDAGPENSDGHEAWNRQIGNRNESFITQESAGARNLASTQQIGNDNQAKQMQNSTAGVGGDGHYAAIEQGAVLSPHVPFVDFIAAVGAPLLDPNIDPFYAGQSFDRSVGAKAKQTQNGIGQNAQIVQWGGAVDASNYAEQEQDGAYNTAGIFQDHPGTGADNYAKQVQDGAVNFAGIWQDGSGNKALQTQTGFLNIAGSTQVGTGNMVNTHQFGDFNTAYTAQRGDNNAALVVQYDGQSYSVEQGLLGPSSGNQADILQLGPDGDFGASGVDCYFDEQMNLDMDYTVPDFDLEDVCPDC
ncbi:curlin [Zeaxanthinibacter sp. PT1]|uniref:curlin n=1 Tax=Zeaxanthinibacter TaxID=561554 RepID=UPI002349B651|nr:curlin [Zeaxanthinibacter sp. PT1]MDC6352449.1 curlin [Zeaxanthinibacter sp. PT1]